MGTTPATNGADCPAPPFQHEIDTLEKESNQQDVSDAKSRLATIRKINDDVEKDEGNYKKDYEGLVFAAEQSRIYEANRETQLLTKLSPTEKKIIDAIVKCAPIVDDLEKKWKDARKLIPGLQQIYSLAQLEFLDADERYTAFRDYKANQKDLDSLQAQATKEIEAQNYRGSYFLVVHEMKTDLKNKVLSPDAFNAELKTRAEKYFTKFDEQRKAKIALDQGTADAQKKKKEFDDAKSKRRDNILKQIAQDPFIEAPANGGSTSGDSSLGSGEAPSSSYAG